MQNNKLLTAGWTLLNNSAALCKPLLWLRDTDSALPLAPTLIKTLRSALRTIAAFPHATEALCDKMGSIYQRALVKPWVGIGAQERSTRLGQRTAQFGLMYALEYARNKQHEFDEHIASLKEQGSHSLPDWDGLFALVSEFIDCLDWGEFVIENPRGQASNLVLESTELLEAIQSSAEKIPEETGDVFYNLMALCLSLRIRPSDMFPGATKDEDFPDYHGVLEDPMRIAEFINDRIDSKVAWYKDNIKEYYERQWSTWQEKVLEVLYKGNLGITIPKDGEVICDEGDVLIIKWRSTCPVLKRCQRQGCPTSYVCSTLYHVQYQALLSLLVPGAFFARDYSKLRPMGDDCIEVIVRRPDTEEFAQEKEM